MTQHRKRSRDRGPKDHGTRGPEDPGNRKTKKSPEINKKNLEKKTTLHQAPNFLASTKSQHRVEGNETGLQRPEA